MKSNLRMATLEDLPRLLELEQKLIAFERGCDPNIRTGEGVYYYDLPTVINHPDVSTIIVAEIDDEIVGCGMGTIKKIENWAKGDLFGMINMVYTEVAHRDKKIASQILTSLRDWFLSRDVTDIRLKVYTNNEGAIKAYEKNGFKPFVTEMQLST